MDWEESLWETDPTKKDTDDNGISDNIEIENLKKQAGKNENQNFSLEDNENLTKTDQFSRELFATVAALNQGDTLDQATIDALSISLSEQIQNSMPKKIYVLADINTTSGESVQAVQKYRDTLISIYENNTTEKGVPEILEELVKDEENMSILKELDPIINQIEKIIIELTKIEVPQSFAFLHLELTNTSQRLLENIRDIRLLDNDPLLAIGAISQYFENSLNLESTTNKLTETMQQKLNN